MYKNLIFKVHKEKGNWKGRREQIHFVKAAMTGISLEISYLPVLITLLKPLPDYTRMYSLIRMESLESPFKKGIFVELELLSTHN